MSAQPAAQRSSSLERKLVFAQFWRSAFMIIGLDMTIILLFLGGVAFYCEQTAQNLLREPNPERNTPDIQIAQVNALPFNAYLPETLAEKLEKLDSSRYFATDIRFDYKPQQALEHMTYTIITPTEDRVETGANSWWRITFSLRGTVLIFEGAFAVLLFIELLNLLTASFKIRKSVQRTLRPIYDLTMIAQSMNGTDSQELHSAIDTLNTITENDLDRRIVISDERQELRGLAEAINAMLDRLNAAYHSQLRFVSDASHELRTPIAVIQGYANLLDRWGKNDQKTLQESIDAIKVEAASMQALVEQLLFLARSDNRSIVLKFEEMDICTLADEVLRETQMIDANHEFAINRMQSLFVHGDCQLLKQALRILIDNAIKYTPQGGKITISIRQEEAFAKIAVSDTGIGIPKQDLGRVFDRFFRADESRARASGGTGLGLSIAKWIVDRHGGFVEIISRQEIGTKVTFALPLDV